TMRLTERLTPLAAAMSALSTLACCLPLGLAGAAGALGLSVVLETLRPWLIALSLILLCIGGFQMFRTGRSCRARSRLSLTLLALSAIIVLGVVLLPQLIAGLLASSLP